MSPYVWDWSSIVNAQEDSPFKTKRVVVGQITICRGCCCGNSERGLPEAPVDWLKREWRRRGLLKRVQFTISGCVGPCDVTNVVVVITSSSGTVWLGNISKFEEYRCWLPCTLERRRPQHPHPEGSQGGVRQAPMKLWNGSS